MSLPDLVRSDWVECLVRSLAHTLWQGMLLLVFVGVIDLALRGRSSQARYALWFGALCLMLLCLPMNVALLAVADTDTSRPPSSGRALLATPTGATNDARSVEDSAETRWQGDEQQMMSGSPMPSAEPEPSPQAFSSSESEAMADSLASTEPSVANESSASVWQRISAYVVAVYSVGVFGMLMRLMIGMSGAWRLQARGVLVEDETLLSRFEHCARKMGLRARPVVAYCSRVAVPIVVGVVKPVVLLPVALASQLTAEQLEAVVLHEFAHIRRWDTVMNLAQRIIETLLFFHPAVWIVSRRVTSEREHCCDDLVLRSGSEPCCYAESLVRLSELRHEASALSHETGAVLAATTEGRTRLGKRVLRILGQTAEGSHMQTASRSLVVSLGLAGVFLLGFASVAVLDVARSEEATAVEKSDESHVAQVDENTADVNAGAPAAADQPKENDELVDVETANRAGVERFIRQLKDEDPLIRRASIAALAERIDPIHLALFIDALDDEHPEVRSGAVYALSKIGNSEAIEPLVELLKRSRDGTEARFVIYALQAIDDERVVEPIIRAWQRLRGKINSRVLKVFHDSAHPELNDLLLGNLRLGNGRVDRDLAALLVHRGDLRIADVIAAELTETPEDERYLVAALLAELSDDRCLEPLLESLSHEDLTIRQSAIRSLGTLGDSRATAAIINTASQAPEDWYGGKVRKEAARALAKIGGEEAIAAVSNWAGDREVSWRTRTEYVEALRTSDDPRAAGALIDLVHPDEVARVLEEVAEALGQVGDDRAVDTLKQLTEHSEERVRSSAETAYADAKLGAMRALHRGDNEKAFELAVAGFRGDDEGIILAAARALRRTQDERAIDVLAERTSDERHGVRYGVFRALRSFDSPRAAEVSARFLNDSDDDIRVRTATAMASRADQRSLEPLLQFSTSGNEHHRRDAAKALGKFKDARALKRLHEMLADDDYHTRKDVANVLSKIGDASALDALLGVLDKPNPGEQLEPLVKMLGRIDDPRAIERLERFLAHDEFGVRRAAARSLARLGWKPQSTVAGLRYLAASGRRKELEAVIPPATSSGEARVAGEFHLDAPITARVSAGTAEWPIVVSAGSVEFTEVEEGLKGVVQVSNFSWPPSNWRVQIDLFGKGRQKLGSAHGFVRTSGTIITVRLRMPSRPIRMRFDSIDSAAVESFELSITLEPKAPKPGEPVVETSKPFEAPLKLDEVIACSLESKTARGETIFQVSEVQFSMGKPERGRPTVDARLSLDDAHVSTAKWRLWMIFLDDEHGRRGHSSGEFQTHQHSETNRLEETTTLRLPFTVGKEWKPGGRFRFGVELVPRTDDELAEQLTLGEGNSIPDQTVKLSHVDETAEGKRSIGASGHAVRFDRSDKPRYVEAIQFFGSRYGSAKPPKEDFDVFLLNEKYQVLTQLKIPYSLIPRGKMKWHTLRTPSIEVPETFYVAVAFNPHRTKGVYLGLDENVAKSHSLTGLVGDGFEAWKEKSDWMIRLHLAERPTGEKGIQKLADWRPPPPSKDVFAGTIEYRADDGQSAGKQSYGGAGPVIRIPLDEVIPEGSSIKDVMLKGLRVYASRYGSGFDPEQTKFHVDVVDSDANTVWKQSAPYALFGYKPRWVDIPFERPVAIVDWLEDDHTLTVGIDPESHKRKGIYFHYSKAAEGRDDSAGFVPGKRFFKADGRQWMIRAYLVTERDE